MFCSLRPLKHSRRLFCSSTASPSLQSRLSSNSPPSTGVLYQRKPVVKNERSPIYGFSAPSTTCISPVDVAYSRFLNRHAPLEVANRLLRMAEKKEPRKDAWQESMTWQSATGTEYEFQRIPYKALDYLNRRSASTSTDEHLWGRAEQENAEEEDGDDTVQLLESIESAVESSPKFSGKVVVVRAGQRELSGKDFYDNLMSAVQAGLTKIEDYEMTSTKRKRRLKMNKHKYKKRRKEQEALRRKLGK